MTLDDTDGDNTNGVQDTLTFTAGDWDTAQTVTARAVDDADSNNESVALTATASEYDDGAGTRLSASLTVTVADDDALAMPGSVAVTAQVRALRVGWNAVSAANGYKVQWKSGGQGYTAGREESATGTSHTGTGRDSARRAHPARGAELDRAGRDDGRLRKRQRYGDGLRRPRHPHRTRTPRHLDPGRHRRRRRPRHAPLHH